MADSDVASPLSPSRAPGDSPTRVRYLVLGLACGISFLLYLQRYAWAFVKKDAAREFGWDTVTLGWLDGIFVIPYGVGQIPTGMLCDWFGAHALLGSSIVLWSLALAGVAVANGLTSMAAARVAFGAFQAGGYPVLNKVSKNWFPLSMRTTAQSCIATFFGRGGGAASFFLVGTVLLGWCEMPWRGAILLLSGLGVACGIAFLLLFRNTPREHPWVNAAEADLIVTGDPQAAQATRSVMRWGRLARSLSFWFLLVRSFASNMADVVFVYWIPLYLQEEKHLDYKSAGWLAALPLIGGACGGLFSGWMQSNIISRTGRRRWARSGLGMAGKGTAAVLTLFSLRFVDPLAVMGMLVLVKFFCDWEQPAEWGTISDIGGRNAATLFGCVNTMGSLGGFVASLLNGQILKAFSVDNKLTTAGWDAVFVLIAIEYVAASLCWFAIDCRKTIEPSPA